MKPIVTYLRVSTSKQGQSGLGIEAQREALSRFAQTEGSTSSPNSSRSRPAKEAMRLTAAAVVGSARQGAGTAMPGRRIEA